MKYFQVVFERIKHKYQSCTFLYPLKMKFYINLPKKFPPILNLQVLTVKIITNIYIIINYIHHTSR